MSLHFLVSPGCKNEECMLLILLKLSNIHIQTQQYMEAGITKENMFTDYNFTAHYNTV
jgi:hypothetical protein